MDGVYTLLLFHPVEVFLRMTAYLDGGLGLHMLGHLAPRSSKKVQALQKPLMFVVCPALAGFGDRVWLPGL